MRVSEMDELYREFLEVLNSLFRFCLCVNRPFSRACACSQKLNDYSKIFSTYRDVEQASMAG